MSEQKVKSQQQTLQKQGFLQQPIDIKSINDNVIVDCEDQKQKRAIIQFTYIFAWFYRNWGTLVTAITIISAVGGWCYHKVSDFQNRIKALQTHKQTIKPAQPVIENEKSTKKKL